MRLKWLMIILLCLVIVHTPIVSSASPGVSARNAVLMEQSTGRVLFEKQAHNKEKIASITKIMTAIVAIESGMLEDTVKVSRRAVYEEGSSIYLEQGEEMKLKDLVYGLMLRSGNDAATAIAEHVGGSLEGFVFLMNQKADWIGMDNSHFANPHGLDAEDHYSTAYDMALLTRYAMNNEIFRKVSSTTTYKAESRTYAWGNKNKMLTKYYDHSTGGKTGYTKSAGRTLVSTAEKDGMELIMVTLNAPDDWNDHRNMFEWGYETYDLREIQDKGELQLEEQPNEGALGYLWEPVIVPLTKEEANQIEQITYTLKPNLLESVNTVLGKAVYELNGEKIADVPLMAEPAKVPSFWKETVEVFKRMIGVQ
ncbi:D-alanyl-D-alanine carboxypeptidase family protein [Pontibacillus yanchengensis]|uniref:D-alanyl-D-alanine carboxypeptidase n=1 Tax=Pontibacillus yanchengensis Y32 TaxID=1385514 RepID=A0A0A2TA34_9BACI|nr:D-alanyl-D-alanine carboxypeptidase family protein [Pontibacillus yanchengensis]KGP70931.1 D-alanyl-D-alanine carboxypeptidase [Pontibacillus yanchengensis Y32]